MRGQHYGDFFDASDEVVGDAGNVADDFDFFVALLDFFPQNAQWHFRQAVAHTAVNTKAKRNMLARIRTVDNQTIGVVEHIFVTIARDIPHDVY